MAGGPDLEAVKAALRILGEAGRVDPLRPGVLDEAWVGLMRASCAAAQGVAAATAACLSPIKQREKKGKKGRGRGAVAPIPSVMDLGTKGEPQPGTDN
ncbi:hypothetical protein NDU88_006670 [Pleurodeles waltl]|uniref:Uncharacterized protein n=1 Tax=Pleurodeles waltl TaxID=8319 RepID=A0AAV7X4Q3_PLEWA|nr:hypothetical protein NDU88_006670 [Pleurodeles waltl]